MKKLLTNKEILEIMHILENKYPNATCGLTFNNSFELAIALILAAQCTDKRVNLIRPRLTNTYTTWEELANANIANVYMLISSCSFPNNKAKHIIECSKQVVKKYSGVLPNTMSELTTLSGIGRKSANIILSDYFHTPNGIAVDTHVKRLSRRLGFTNSQNVSVIEKTLINKIPISMHGYVNHLLVEHGKNICTARTPKCNTCFLSNICHKNIK